MTVLDEGPGDVDKESGSSGDKSAPLPRSEDIAGPMLACSLVARTGIEVIADSLARRTSPTEGESADESTLAVVDCDLAMEVKSDLYRAAEVIGMLSLTFVAGGRYPGFLVW